MSAHPARIDIARAEFSENNERDSGDPALESIYVETPPKRRSRPMGIAKLAAQVARVLKSVDRHEHLGYGPLLELRRHV